MWSCHWSKMCLGVCLCECAYKTSMVPSQLKCRPRQQINTRPCPPFFIYSYNTDVCSIFCVHNIIHKGSVTEAGGMRRKQQTVCDKQNTIKLSECGSLYALVYRLERTDFFHRWLPVHENDETMSIPLPRLKNAVTKNKATVSPLGRAHHILEMQRLNKKIDNKWEWEI